MSDENKDKEVGGVDPKVIERLEAKVKALEAERDAEAGKAGGILADKKKAQERAEALQSELDELKGKDLGEVERMKLEIERMQSKVDKANEERENLRNEYETAQRNNFYGDVRGKVKFLDSIPEDAQKTLIETYFKDVDMGNEVIVEDRLKSFTESHSGMIKAEIPQGTGSKAGDAPHIGNQSVEGALNKPLDEIASDPKAYVQSVLEASQSE